MRTEYPTREVSGLVVPILFLWATADRPTYGANMLRGREEGTVCQDSSVYKVDHNAELSYLSRARSRVLIGTGGVLLSTVHGEEVAWITKMRVGWSVECFSRLLGMKM
jgi:hypothetical protein